MHAPLVATPQTAKRRLAAHVPLLVRVTRDITEAVGLVLRVLLVRSSQLRAMVLALRATPMDAMATAALAIPVVRVMPDIPAVTVVRRVLRVLMVLTRPLRAIMHARRAPATTLDVAEHLLALVMLATAAVIMV